jgi:hypothetical protein
MRMIRVFRVPIHLIRKLRVFAYAAFNNIYILVATLGIWPSTNHILNRNPKFTYCIISSMICGWSGDTSKFEIDNNEHDHDAGHTIVRSDRQWLAHSDVE